jgi:hypothetical protein
MQVVSLVSGEMMLLQYPDFKTSGGAEAQYVEAKKL